MTGRIIKALAGFYYVKDAAAGEVYACRAKGIFRKRNHSPLVGDLVDFAVTHEGDREGNIEAINPRTSVLSRPTVANVDLGLVVFALKDPDPNLHLLDRMLVVLAHAGLPCAICFNKQDLVEEDRRREIGAGYEALGYPVAYTCAAKGEGGKELQDMIDGHLVSLVGPSGAGKSSLVNLLSGRSSMEVGEISDKIRRGKQTTRHVELVEIRDSTFIVDTPGFSSLDFAGIEKEELGSYFPEIEPLEKACKFARCSHIYEPEEDCAVRQRVAAGQIARERYESYRMFYEELAGMRKW